MTRQRRLIVYESRPYWQPELQRRFLREDVEVIGCRSVPDLEAHAHSADLDAAILELAGDEIGCLRWLAGLDAGGRSLPVVVVTDAAHAAWEWLVRELGATVFVDEFVGGARMASICRKLWLIEATPRSANCP